MSPTIVRLGRIPIPFITIVAWIIPDRAAGRQLVSVGSPIRNFRIVITLTFISEIVRVSGIMDTFRGLAFNILRKMATLNITVILIILASLGLRGRTIT
jgi:hypothetical protein